MQITLNRFICGLMSVIVSSILPFPNLYWWSLVSGHSSLVLDKAEHFQKMTYRNRYYITGANGLIHLSIPLINGRNQRTAMCNVEICYKERWQVQQWRTIVSVYKRAPYFEHYEPVLEKLMLTQHQYLAEYNHASINWLMKELRLNIEQQTAATYIAEYSDAVDIRTNMKPGLEKNALPEKDAPYYQLFSERNGFLPNLSMLDLLFVEGPHALQWIKKHRELISGWGSMR